MKKNHPILTDLSAKFGEAGSNVVGVIGPNGTGKSTLFLNLVGMLKPTGGQILVDDQPINYSKKGLNQLRQKNWHRLSKLRPADLLLDRQR